MDLITLDSSHFIPLDLEPSFPPSDDQVPASTSYSLASTPLHTHAANDFAYLQDHMFKDEFVWGLIIFVEILVFFYFWNNILICCGPCYH